MDYRVIVETETEPDGVAVYYLSTAVEALIKVRRLRSLGYRVRITGPTGGSISERQLKVSAKNALTAKL
jgi:hypothetical protein